LNPRKYQIIATYPSFILRIVLIRHQRRSIEKTKLRDNGFLHRARPRMIILAIKNRINERNHKVFERMNVEWILSDEPKQGRLEPPPAMEYCKS
jgi:hypothetical protein